MGIGGEGVLDKTDYVLEQFSKRELKVIEKMLIDARRLVDSYINNGIESTMNRFN